MKKKWIIIGSLTILLSIFIYYILFLERKINYYMGNSSEIIIEMSNDNIYTQNDFCQLVTDALNFDKDIIIQSCVIDQDKHRRIALFSKTFERTFFQRIFSGVKRVSCIGEISLQNYDTIPNNISLKIHWRKYYDNERYERVEDGEYDYFIDATKIQQNITNWENTK